MKFVKIGLIAGLGIPFVLLLALFGIASFGGNNPVTTCPGGFGNVANGEAVIKGDQISQLVTHTVTTTTTVDKKTQTSTQTVTTAEPIDSSQISIDSGADIPTDTTGSGSDQTQTTGSADIYGGQFSVNGESLTDPSQIHVSIVLDPVGLSGDGGGYSTAGCGALPTAQLASGGYLGCAPQVSSALDSLTIDGQPLTQDQVAIALAMTQFVSANSQLTEQDAVTGIATGLEETQLHNWPYGTGTSVGFLQQSSTWGTVAQRMNIDDEIQAFYEGVNEPSGPDGLIEVQAKDPQYVTPEQQATAVQQPLAGAYDQPGNNFAMWLPVATAIVNALEANCSVSSTLMAMIKAAQSVEGIQYQWGGDSETNGFDCSGLVWWAFNQAGYPFTRTNAAGEYNWGQPVSLQNLQPGDLVFWATNDNDPSTIGHVAIYIGNGQIIQAPHTGAVVSQSAMYLDTDPGNPDNEHFIGGIRVSSFSQ